MARMNLARLKGFLGAPQAPLDPMEPDVDDQVQAPVKPKGKPKGKVKRKLFGKAKGEPNGGEAY